uniref:Uncharacterized protein n=1 Tax=Arundo donax TaxID=35708 RepID=A0A0A8ZPS2_ARUDO
MTTDTSKKAMRTLTMLVS